MKKYFAGGNTSRGFVGFFDDIREYDRAGKTFIIKGGAGTGKSTLMKKVGAYIESKGADVDYFYCSGDSGSLDAVYARELNFVVLDGTAPHATEPKTLGAEDVYVDVAAGIDVKKISAHERTLKSLSAKKKNDYLNCYAYLRAAGEIAKVNLIKNEEGANKNAELIIDRLRKLGYRESRGRAEMKFFLSAITAEGTPSFATENYANVYRVEVKGVDRFSTLASINALYRKLKVNGVECKAFGNALLPDIVESIFFEKDNLFLSAAECSAAETIFLKDTNGNSPYSVVNESECEDLIDTATDFLYSAKKTHQEIEKYYIGSMRWSVVDEIYEKITDQI